jgi:putative ABC transport system permease protein
MRPRLQKILSDLWGNPLRSLLVLASIAVGLFALGVITTISIVGPQDMQTGYAAINPANLYLSTSLFDQGLVDRIKNLPGVYQAQGERDFSSRLEASPGNWIAIDLKATKDPGERQINQLRLIEGVWPPGDREIVIDQYKLPSTNAKLGDMVTLELPSGQTRQLKLVGVVEDQTIGAYRGAGGFFNAPVQGYITRGTVEWLQQPAPKSFNVLYVTVRDHGADRAQLEAVAQTVREAVEKNNITIISTAQRSSTEHPNLFLARAILIILIIIGLLVVFLSGFLITNTLQALMTQQVQQIGILKTVGARRMQVANIYLLLSLLFGVIAFLIAVPLSYEVGFSIVSFLTTQLNYRYFGQRLVPQVAILQGVIAVLMPQVAALVPVLQGTRISVQEALSGLRQDHPPDQSWFDRRISRLRKSSLVLLIALRNTFRHKWRLLLTLVTLSLGGAVFIATFNVRVAMMNYVQQITQYFLADVNVTLDRAYPTDEINSLILAVPGVSRVEGWMFARSELINLDDSIGESVSLLAPPAESPLIKPILVEGRWIKPGDRNAIALSELFRDYYPNLHVGGTLRLRVNGDETDWVVVGFFQLGGKITGLSAYTSYEYLSELIHQPGRAISYRVVASQPNLANDQQKALGHAIEAHLDTYGIRVTDITTGAGLTDTASSGFNVLTAILLFLASLTALVGSIGLTGTMSLNVMERIREIGILRAIGAADRALMQMVLTEGALIGMISWAAAALLAFPITTILSDSIGQALFGAPSKLGFTPIGFVIWAGVVALLSVGASVLPARNAARLTIREVLYYE